MTKQDYEAEMKVIENDFDMAKNRLYYKFALANRLYEAGDIISNGDLIIQVSKFKVGKTLGLPYPIYIGLELKKDLTPKKNETIGSIFGNDNTKCLKKAIS